MKGRIWDERSVFGAMGDGRWELNAACSGKAGQSLLPSVDLFNLPRLVVIGVEDGYAGG
jgi:hypothetical protein